MIRFIFAPDDKTRIDQAVDMADSAVILLLTGIALVISGIIQATHYGLAVYHGLVLLALSWLTLLAAIPPYLTMVFNALSFLPEDAQSGNARGASSRRATSPPPPPSRQGESEIPPESLPLHTLPTRQRPLPPIPPFPRLPPRPVFKRDSTPADRPVSDRESQSSSTSAAWNLLNGTRMSWLLTLHCLHLSFTSAFGLWLFIRMRTFDTSPPPVCTSSTLYKVFGVTHPVLDDEFRRFSLALYGLTLVPSINLILVAAAMGALTGGVITIWLIVHMPMRLSMSDDRWTRYKNTAALVLAVAGAYGPLVFVAIVIITSVEGTIAINQIAPGEDVWNLGQTLALFVACFPLLDLAKWVYRTGGLCLTPDR